MVLLSPKIVKSRYACNSINGGNWLAGLNLPAIIPNARYSRILATPGISASHLMFCSKLQRTVVVYLRPVYCQLLK
jgi:hypothetical protein